MIRLPARVTALTFTALVVAPLFAANTGLRVVIGQDDVLPARVRSIEVTADTMRVDAATITIDANRRNMPAAGEAVTIGTDSSDAAGAVFKGEVVGIEPTIDKAGGGAVTVRAMNRLHRLTRGRKSRTFEKMSDADIASRIAAESGLTLGPTGQGAREKRDYVVQDNQTDLEFLRGRAASIGADVWVDDTTLFFARAPEARTVNLGCSQGRGDGTIDVRVFHPRLSSAGSVVKVTVRGWDPYKKKEIVGKATREIIPLSPGAAALTDTPGIERDLGVVIDLDSGSTVYGAANGALMALTALDVSAEADVDGDAALRVGAVLTLSGGNRRFDGKYIVAGAQHRFVRGSDEGWHTLLRIVRADRGVFVLPEVDDEVLVAFVGGDLAQPYVVGSVWNATERPAEAPFCRAGGK